MATKNAPFYSRRAGDASEIKSHKTLSGAMNAAKEHGQIWIAEKSRQRQVHEVSCGGWGLFAPDGYAPDMKAELTKLGLI